MSRNRILRFRDEQSYEQRRKLSKVFYMHLLQVFLVTLLICCCGLGYLWFWLDRYERQSPYGAMNAYMQSVKNEEWDAIYETDAGYFIELNSKDVYISYLQKLYEDVDLNSLIYSQTGVTDNTTYYNVYSNKEYLSTLELIKPSDSKTYKVRTIGSIESYSFDLLESNIAFSINGVSISTESSHETDHIPYAFQDLGLDSKMPSVTRYTISSFVGEPSVTADSEDYMAVRDYSSNQFYIGLRPTDDQYTEFTKEIEDTAFAYSSYITEDGTFYDLNKHLYPNTEFYNSIAGFNNQWFSTHNAAVFSNVIMSDVMPIGDNAFLGSIAFDYTVSTEDNITKTYSSKYQLFFVKNSQGNWKLTNLILVNE